MIHIYSEFITELHSAGFSGAVGVKDDDVFGLFRYGWDAEDENAPHWHTGDPDTDPWEWRVRVLNERDDIAYGKVFFHKAGYITRQWYPYFLAARRDGNTFDELYLDGLYSLEAKRVYETLTENRGLPVHEIKALAGFGRDDKSRFERALTDLQMGLFITMCGQAQKRSKIGGGYGWASMIYCTTEQFWGDEIFEQAAKISSIEAAEIITEQIFKLNPEANVKRIRRFIWPKGA
jgi:hypothetical protein